jgi:hypothetical protein
VRNLRALAADLLIARLRVFEGRKWHYFARAFFSFSLSYDTHRACLHYGSDINHALHLSALLLLALDDDSSQDTRLGFLASVPKIM